MARGRRRRRKPISSKPAEEPEKKKDPFAPSEPGTETSGDTHLVNALESDPTFFKDPLIGEVIGKCTISGLLGEGRTAVVYEATYKPLKRTVAVKVLQKEMTKYPGVVRVFQQEGRAVAALDHENVVKIYDVGEDRGQHYLVLELLRGKDVLKHIEASEGIRLPVDEALDFTRQAARGLAAAHRKNLIHRDIKPQNLVIEPDGKLKIVDFGLAAEAEGAFAGGRLGTPHYMSPEVCRGEIAGTASDIYALGITLFHMLVGHAPFAGRKTTEEIVQDHLRGDRLQPEKLKPDIPKPVADLVRKMTRQDPQARPSAKAVAELIAERLTPEKLGARHKTRPTRGRRKRTAQSSNTTIFLIGGAVVVVLLAFLLMGGDQDEPAPKQPAKPKRPAAEKPKTPVKTPRKLTAVGDKALQRDLKDLMAQAKREEGTGNYSEALILYQRAMLKAPPGSRMGAEAKAAAETMRARLMREQGIKRGGRKLVSARESEKAGREFVERQEKFWEMLSNFDVTTVKAEVQKLIDRTREGSAERAAIQLALDKMRYVESLLRIMESRAASLPASQADWHLFDMSVEEGFLVVAANERGVQLNDPEYGNEKELRWAAISSGARVAFLEALRNPKSATETLWLGAYCKLLGEGAAEQYFSYALMLDSSPEMKAQIKALRKG